MFDDLYDKLKYEQETYFCFLKLISRTEFYTKSYEITVKKAIYAALFDDLNNNHLANDLDELLLRQENSVDFIYMKAVDDAVIWKEKLTPESWSLIKAKIKF